MTRLLLLLALTASVACTDDVDPTDIADTDEDTEEPDFTAGAAVFADNCAGCHAADGSGNTGPDLNTRVPALDEAAVKDTVLNGTGNMPAIGVTDDEAADVAAFVVDKHG